VVDDPLINRRPAAGRFGLKHPFEPGQISATL
jgi:hypothetical protein